MYKWERRFPSLRRKLREHKERAKAQSAEVSGPPNHVSDLTWTRLRSAIETDDIQTVERFITVYQRWILAPCIFKEGCAQCGQIRTVTDMAAHAGHVNVFERLYRHWQNYYVDTDLDDTGRRYHHSHDASDACRLLHKSCRHGNLDLARFLFDNFSSVDEVRSDLKDIFLSALVSGNVELIVFIYSKMTDLSFRHNVVEVVYREGRSSEILFALGLSTDEMNEKLDEMQCPKPHRTIFMRQDLGSLGTRWWRFSDFFGRTAFSQACAQGNVDVVKTMFQILEKTEYELKFDDCGFDLAVKYDRLDVVQFLLDYEWKSEVDWIPRLQDACTVALEARLMRIAEVLLHRLITVRVNSPWNATYRRSTSVYKKIKYHQKTLPPLCSYYTRDRVVRYATADLLESILIRVGPVFREKMLDSYSVQEQTTEYLLEKHQGTFSEEQLKIMINSCPMLSLDKVERLLSRIPANADVSVKCFSRLYEWFYYTMDRFHASRRPTRTFYVLAARTLLLSRWNVPTFIDRVEVILKNVKELCFWDAIFDVYDFSDVIELGGGACFGFDDNERIMSLLISMCGWSTVTVQWSKLLTADIISAGSEKSDVLLSLMKLTGISVPGTLHWHQLLPSKIGRVLEIPSAVLLDDFIARNGLPNDSSVLSLKALCRVAIRKHLRGAWTCRSMIEMLLTLRDEKYLPPSLVDYLLFRSLF